MSTIQIHSEPNPFSTRFVRPGAIDYQRLDGGTLDQLVAEFFGRCRGWAAIIGPHGSGKSTLIASLKPVLAKDRPIFAYRFSTTDREFQLLWSQCSQWSDRSVIVVDGYEQLSAWGRWRLHAAVRRRKAGLLITAHQRYRSFALLMHTSVDEVQAKCLRDALLEKRPDLAAANDLEAAWSAARREFPTDLRETMMSMYDWVEDQKQKRPASHNNSRAV